MQHFANRRFLFQRRERDSKTKRMLQKIVKRFIPFCLVACLCLQSVFLVNNYLAFPTVQSIGTIGPSKEANTAPAVTLCDRTLKGLEEFYKDAYCLSNKNKFIGKEESQVLFSKVKNLNCVTYLSRLSSQMLQNPDKSQLVWNNAIVFLTTKTISHLRLHSSTTPAQMLDVLLSPGCYDAFQVRVKELHLIPAPYDTNCTVYDDPSKAISRDDCIFRCLTKPQNVSEIYVDNFTRFSDLLRWPVGKQLQKHSRAEIRTCSHSCPKQCQLLHYRMRTTMKQHEARIIAKPSAPSGEFPNTAFLSLAAAFESNIERSSLSFSSSSNLAD